MGPKWRATRPHRLPFIATSIALAGSGAAEPVLYIADPAADAIYECRPNQPNSAPQFVSGKLSILADKAAFLSADEVLFSVASRDLLMDCDLAKGELREAARAPEGMTLLALNAGGLKDGVAVLYGADDGTLMLRRGRRNTTDGWKFADTAVPFRRNAGANRDASVLALDEQRVVLFVDGASNSELVLWLPDGKEPPRTLAADLEAPVVLAPSGESNWLAYSQGGNSTQATLYDRGGSVVKELPLDRIKDAKHWAKFRGDETPPSNPTPYGADFVLLSDNDNDTSHSEQGEGRGDSRWRLFHSATGGVYWTGADGRNLTRELALQRGTGPAFEMIRDMAMGNDGKLYVLDGLLPPLRVVQVDPASGDRRVAALLPPDAAYDRLSVCGDGSLLLPRVEQQVETVMDGGVPTARAIEYQAFDAVQPTEDPARPAVRVAQRARKIRRLQDFTASSPSRIRVLLEYSEGLRVGVMQGSQFVATPSLQYTDGRMEFFQDQTGEHAGYRGYVGYPVAGGPKRPIQLRFSLSTPGGPELHNLHTLRMTAPDAHTQFEVPVQDPFHDWYIWEGALFWRESAQVQVPESLGVAGAWKVEADGLKAPGLDLTLSMIGDPAPRARFLDVASDGAIWLIETHPAALLKWSESDGNVERVPIKAGDGPASEDLNRPSQLLLSPGGDVAYVACFEKPLVAEVNRKTGAARILSTGRPKGFDERMLDMSPTSHLRIALGEDGHSRPDARWEFGKTPDGE